MGVPVWRVQEALLAAERFTVALPLKAPLQAMVDRVKDLLVRIKEVVPNPATVGNSLCPCCAVGSWGRAPTFDSPLSCFCFLMPSTLVVRCLCGSTRKVRRAPDCLRVWGLAWTGPDRNHKLERTRPLHLPSRQVVPLVQTV